VPEVREREAHDPAFRVFGTREREQGVEWVVRVVIFFWTFIRRRLLRRRLRLQKLARQEMKARGAVFSRETVLFFRELGRNNHKAWMDANRERYRAKVVEPFRVLLERLTPTALKLNGRFVVSGRTGENFSRINRDIRFSTDKAPYRTQMYLFFAEPGGEGGQLYTGVSAETVTCGFRIYGGAKSAPLTQVGRPRAKEHTKWLERQKRRLAGKYESYWYSSEKGEWTKHKGWPVKPEQWKKLRGWVVRRKVTHAAATLPGFERQSAKILREVYPLLPFTSSPDWKP
jgi:uncharacterized protein (TIGR02453 family)